MAAAKKVPASSLFVSEPNPRWFGNRENEAGNARWTNANWLKSRFHFSFAEYSDRRRDSFGCLRVLNDDLVQPMRGFGKHPHRNMEIVTYVVEGALTHKDSTGTEETLRRGAIQFMTAGTGVYHSEHNMSADSPLRFIQMWIEPRRLGLPPNYGSYESSREERANRWAHLVGSVGDNGAQGVPVAVHQDVNLYVCELEGEGEELPAYPLKWGRQAYLLCMEGEVEVQSRDGDGKDGDAVALARHDACQLFGEREVALALTPSGGNAHVLMLEMRKR
eukprot:CAMPEP_0197493356 /NCGR_PEP_ID=MMETSP1311-20131121/21350_1 /TAXON_ID=464262 /ORGANISM="Genus nov. species nov., Strain RCC856" /LENGTH=275 /DNA_ID=CAMNT_0043038587 /DNA_START=93 /DNA_END=920 /DNA_ORIENTATION=+